MIKEILTFPEHNEILTKISAAVDLKEDNKQLIQDLKDTLHNTKNGVGISAVQIGVLKRICVIRFNSQDMVLINPIIERTRGTVTRQEGCLSVPDKYGEFERAEKVWCTYIDENGKQKEIAAGGLLARIIQHEIEHFDGWCRVFELMGGE